MEKKQIIDAIIKDCDDIKELLEKNSELFIDDSPAASLLFNRIIRMSKDMSTQINGLKGYEYVVYKEKKLKPETKRPLEDAEIIDKNTPFYKKKVVFTGELDGLSREGTAEVLRKFGADINTSISSKTDIVIMGHGAGPSKMKKIEELKAKGVDIKILNQEELLDVMRGYGII